MEKLPVIFRRDKEDSSIVAIFPTIWETGDTFLPYAHIGQHGSACYEYYRDNTFPVDDYEYANLLAELTAIYTTRPTTRPDIYGEPVELVVKRRMSPAMREAWLKDRARHKESA